MYEYWYEYVKPKYRKLCHKGIDSFKAHLKSDDIYADPAGEVKKGFDVSNCEFKRPLSVGKNKKNSADDIQIRWTNNERICSPGTCSVQPSHR